MIARCAVTQAMIDADRHCYDACPVAEAIDAWLRPGYKAGVSGTGACILRSNGEYVQELTLPALVPVWVRAYDVSETFAGITVHPFSFDISLPDELVAEPATDAMLTVLFS